MSDESYSTIDDVPEDWIPVGDCTDDQNIIGMRFIVQKSMGIKIVEYQDGENNELHFFDSEIPDLMSVFAEYLHDAFRRRRNS